tara:strand:+ start:32 stop:550 length:519 start_codon:yes stop_codon:yes gene_type:complete
MANSKLPIQLSAGKIKRYHTHPIIGEQTVGEHTYGVVQILRYITGDNCTKSMLMAALDHDVLEYFTGDIPHPAKKMFPELKGLLGRIECHLENEVGLLEHTNLSEKEQLTIRCADLLEMGFFGKYQMDLGNGYGKAITENIVKALEALPSVDVPQLAKDLTVELRGYIDGSK